jgi:hypothetical protein
VLRFARGFFEQIADAGFLDQYSGRIPFTQFRGFMSVHLRHEQRDSYIRYAKWWSSTLLAKHLKQECEQPSDPSWDLYCGTTGWLRLRLRNTVCFERLSNFRLLCSVQQLKRNFLPVGDDFVLASLLKHRKAMLRAPGLMNTGNILVEAWRRYRVWFDETEKKSLPVVDVPRMDVQKTSPENFVPAIERRMQAVLSSFQPTSPRLMQPSGSACFENSRSKGGASYAIAKKYWSDGPAAYLDSPHGELLMMDYHPTFGVKEIRGIPYPDLREVLRDTRHSLTETSTIVRFWDQEDPVVLDVATNDAENRKINCRVAAVLEPGKVRTVTAGEMLPYWVSRSFQKDIHSFLRSIPQFSLCGQPLEKWHLCFLDRLSSSYGHYQGMTVDGERTLWVSGDYSAATDMIDIRLTRACHQMAMRQLCSAFAGHMSDSQIIEVEKILNACIEPHLVSYPKHMVEQAVIEGKDLGVAEQQNGQLMGSTLSFPILCIVNFCVAWQALFPHIEDFRKVPILVNGDDILFRCRESQYRIWCEHIENAGFVKSVGKNFAHPNKIFINSQPWIARKRSDFENTKMCDFEYLPFFNTGLLHGQSKVAKRPACEGASGGTYQPAYSLQPEAVRGAQNQERAIRRFHSVHREHLRHCSADGFFAYHAPREFYGLGMIPSAKARFTRTQQIVCNVLFREHKRFARTGKLYIGDGHVQRPVHDLSRIQGERAIYRGCVVPPDRLKPNANGFSVLHEIEHSELNRSQDVILENDGASAMFSSAWGLRKRVLKHMKSLSEKVLVPYPEEKILLGFCQRPTRSCSVDLLNRMALERAGHNFIV